MQVIIHSLRFIVSLISSIREWAYFQINLLFTYFNPVKVDHAHETFTRRSFIAPFAFIFAFKACGFFALGPTLAFDRIFDVKFYRTYPYIPYHQMIGKEKRVLWSTKDFTSNSSLIIHFLLYLCLFTCQPYSPKRVIRLEKGSRPHQSDELKKMASFQALERRLLQGWMLYSILSITHSHFSSAFSHKETFIVIPRVIAFWLLYPAFIYYNNYSKN